MAASVPFWMHSVKPTKSTAEPPSKSSQRGPKLRECVAYALASVLWLIFVLIAVLEALEYYLIGRRHVRSPGSQLRTELRGELQMAVFDPDDAALDWDWLRRTYCDRGIPFVLRRANGQPLTAVAPPPAAVANAFDSGCIRVVSEPWFVPLPGLDELVRKIFGGTPRAYWPFWFLGQYSQGKAHIDLGPHTHNCYFMRSGSKDVVIVPPEVTRNVPLQTGLDGLFIADSEGEAREYLHALPYYYRVDLMPQSLLVFNNASCIHQFRNVRAPDGRWPEALSLRLKYCASAEPRIWTHLMSNLPMAKRFTDVRAGSISTAHTHARARVRLLLPATCLRLRCTCVCWCTPCLHTTSCLLACVHCGVSVGGGVGGRWALHSVSAVVSRTVWRHTSEDGSRGDPSLGRTHRTRLPPACAGVVALIQYLCATRAEDEDAEGHEA